MNQGIFITGTDTGVGKTVVSAALAFLLREQGLRVGVMKPIATGCLPCGNTLVSDDAVFLFEAAENQFAPLTSPARFQQPVAPFVAQAVEEHTLDLAGVRDAFQRLSREYDYVIVEGIGGLFVPLTQTYLVSNLIQELDLPVVVVARGALGTINHTLLTVDAARIRGLEVKGVIFNGVPLANLSLAELTNPKVVAEVANVPVLGTLPWLEGVDVARCRFGNLKEVARERLNITPLLGAPHA